MPIRSGGINDISLALQFAQRHAPDFLLLHACYACGVWCRKAMLLGRWLEGGVIIFLPEFIWFTSHLLRHFKGRLYYYDCTSLQTMWCCSLLRRALCRIASVQQKIAKNTVALKPASGIVAPKSTSEFP